MRVSSGQVFENQRRNVQANYADMIRWQNQLSSGKRVEKLSDDPFQAGVLLRKRSIKSSIEQYNMNLRVAKDYLGSSEKSLTEMQNLMRNAYQLAVQGASDAVDQPARTALADQVRQMQNRLVELANSRGQDGQFLFGGQLNQTTPYTSTGSALTYNGDINDIRVETAPGQTLKVNTTGGTDFIAAFDALESLRVNLLGGNIGALSGINVDGLKKQVDRFSQLRSEAGVAMQHVQSQEAMNGRRMDELTEGISAIEVVDFAEAVTGLKRAETAYQAALQVSATSFRLSLLDYLR